MNKWSISASEYCSFLRVLKTWRRLFALINLRLTCAGNLQSLWIVKPPPSVKQDYCSEKLMSNTGLYWELLPLLLKISSSHFFGLQEMLFSLDHVVNCPTRLADGSHWLLTGHTTVESYLNRAGALLEEISRSFKDILSRQGPLTLPWVLPLLTTFQLQRWLL